MMRYMQVKGMVTDKNSVTIKTCAEIGNRLIGKKVSVKNQKNLRIVAVLTVFMFIVLVVNLHKKK